MQYQLHPSDENVREAILVAQPFTIAVLYLEQIVELWTKVKASPERTACLRTVIDLLARVEANKDQPSRVVAADRRDLLEVIDDRDAARSTILASQIPVAKWHDYWAIRPSPTPSPTGSCTAPTASC